MNPSRIRVTLSILQGLRLKRIMIICLAQSRFKLFNTRQAQASQKRINFVIIVGLIPSKEILIKIVPINSLLAFCCCCRPPVRCRGTKTYLLRCRTVLQIKGGFIVLCQWCTRNKFTSRPELAYTTLELLYQH